MPLYQRALAIKEQALGATHPDTAISLNNLAALYRAQGDYPAALPLYQRALAICEQALGATHPITKVLRENLEALRRRINPAPMTVCLPVHGGFGGELFVQLTLDRQQRLAHIGIGFHQILDFFASRASTVLWSRPHPAPHRFAASAGACSSRITNIESWRGNENCFCGWCANLGLKKPQIGARPPPRCALKSRSTWG